MRIAFRFVFGGACIAIYWLHSMLFASLNGSIVDGIPAPRHLDCHLNFSEQLAEDRRRLYGAPQKRFTALYLMHQDHYNSKMERSFIYEAEALLRHPWVHAVVSGPGFPDWNARESIRVNIQRMFGAVSNVTMVFVHLWSDKQQLREIQNETVLVYREHECWSRRCGFLARRSILQLAYANDAPQYEVLIANTSQMILHTPHGADPSRFFVSLAEREADIPILVIGAVNCNYPLRMRIAKLIRDKRLPGYIHPHPGYSEGMSQAERKRLGINRTYHEAQVKEYAGLLKRAHIMIGDSSMFRYSLLKFGEAALAGAAIFSELPHERQEYFSKFVTVPSYNATDDQLVQQLLQLLNDSKELREKAQRGQEIFLRHFTWDRLLDDVIMAVQAFVRGEGGLRMPYSFVLGCAAIKREYFPTRGCVFTMSKYCTQRQLVM